VPWVAEASEVVEIVSVLGEITINVDSDAVCAGLLLSLTCTPKSKFPPAVGVPEIRPLDDSVSPAGKTLPAVRLQV
jgi:hypothetical protein